MLHEARIQLRHNEMVSIQQEEEDKEEEDVAQQ